MRGLARTADLASVVIAIPAYNEAERIGTCVAAIAAQRDAPPPLLVLYLNNCDDGTAEAARAELARSDLDAEIVEVTLPPEHAHAGGARRLAMQHACARATPDAVLLTTDADGHAPPDWLAANLRAIAAGADAVAGRVELDADEASLIPAALHEADAVEVGYGALLDELDWLIDPDPADPWPRHDEHNGASIAVTHTAYLAAGGMPAIQLGEDRAFFAALRREDLRIRHALDVRMTVSGRIDGRAEGGMADTIRRRLSAPDLLVDDRYEAADSRVRRAGLRHLLRRVHDGHAAPARLAEHLGLSAAQVIAPLGLNFGRAWEALEAESPVLRRHRLPVAELRAQSVRAQSWRRLLLSAAADDRADIAVGGPDDPVREAADSIA